MSNIITNQPVRVLILINNSSEQTENAHKDIPGFTLEPVTNSQYGDLMDDKILAEMLPNFGENIVPVASASSAMTRSHHISLQCL